MYKHLFLFFLYFIYLYVKGYALTIQINIIIKTNTHRPFRVCNRKKNKLKISSDRLF